MTEQPLNTSASPKKQPETVALSSGTFGKIVTAGISASCPQCGRKSLYAHMLKFAPACAQCGLDFGQFNVGDGAAPFIILSVSAMIGIGMMVLEFFAAPPLWWHIIWVPLGLLLSIVFLRVSKAALLAAEYLNSAGEAEYHHDA
jgi:uncharacterized protein (DUF983 family)